MGSHITVIGAGVVGATTALRLVEQGYTVSLVDQAHALAQGASGANGAQLSYNYTDAMASPDTLKSLPKLLLGLDLSFRFSPRIDLEFIRWGAEFIRNSTLAKSDQNTLAILQIALSSRSVMQEWDHRYGFEYQKTAAQKLHLYESESALEKAKRRVELKNAQGATQQVIDRKRVLELEPALQKMNANLVGAVYSPDDEVGDVIAFTKAAIEKTLSLGAGKLHLSTTISDIVVEQGKCKALVSNHGNLDTDAVVICAGYQSSSLARKLGVKIRPIIPVAGYSLTFPDTEFTPKISLTDTPNKIVLCHLGNQLRVAGMADVGRVAASPPEHRIEQLKQLLIKRFPAAGDYHTSATPWAGMRPMTSDSRPVIKQTALDNVFINSGHGMLGWTLAAGSAQKLTNLLVKKIN
ncbi:MAG: D-amino-acid dehydrogenase [Arenicella sp.]|jgi:D-amino-acid dehydrogenase